MADELILDIVPKFAAGAEDAIKSVFSDAFNKSFTGREQGLLKEVFGHAINEGLTSADSNRLRAVFKSFGGRAAEAAGGAAVSGIGSAVSAAADIGLGLATGGLAGSLEPIMKIVNAISDAVQAANPALVEQLSFAFKDISAVVGHALTPFLEQLIPLVHMYGDYIASVLPDQKTMNELAAAFSSVFKAWMEQFKILAPIVNTLATLFANVLTKALEAVATAVEWLVRMVAAAVAKTMHLAATVSAMATGMDSALTQSLIHIGKNAADVSRGEGTFDRSSRGRAFGGSDAIGVLELSRSMQIAAFAGARKPEERTADATEQLGTIVPKIYDAFVELLRSYQRSLP